MDEPSLAPEVVFESPSNRACMEARLVLESAGITNEVRQRSGGWCLVVPADQVNDALGELQSYREDGQAELQQPSPQKTKVFSGAIVGVIYYALFVISIAVLADSSAYAIDWKSAGHMDAGDVKAGQWYRTVTALTLHVDAGHLFSNLVFGAVFGGMAGRILGGGYAWLVIVLAGAMGNLLNAWMRDDDHVSIGASTAVFAALGIMVAHALHPRRGVATKAFVRWSPLIGGVLLLSFIGLGGERTDVLAHVTGFFAGVVLGWLGCRLPEHWLERTAFQVIAGLITAAIVIGTWVLASQAAV